MRILALAFVLFLTAAAPAQAGPVGAAIGAVVQAITAFAAKGAFASFLVQTALSVGLSLLARALSPKVRAPGIKTDVTQTGGTTPQSFILGWSATGGQLVAPPMSYGKAGDTPNAYLAYVVALSATPGQTLTRLIVNDEYVPVDGAVDGDGMTTVTGKYAGYIRVRFHDGSQTVADPLLRAKFGADPGRPWTADMVGTGTAYAVVVFKYKREVFNGLPSVRFECNGIPLYDPRADSSVGGAGAQRWDTPASWAQSTNPAVITYNILRGIRLPDGNIWGGECGADELPLASWFAAMNECDMAIALEGGGTEPQYRAGFEVSVDEEPADIIDELLKACSGQITEIGGIWKIRIGGPGMPVYFFSDDDILIDHDQVFEPFPGLDGTWNGVHASYPEPVSLWETKDAPPRYNEALEVLDQGRRLIADLTLPAVPYPTQVQRLMQSYINEERRFRRHHVSLPPEAAVLEPLDAIAWTSERHGYSTKLFELFEITDELMQMSQTVGLRERDAADTDWQPSDALPTGIVPPGITTPIARVVPGFAVAATTVTDSGGLARRPALLLTWTGQEADDTRGLEWEVRVKATEASAARGSTLSVADGSLIVSQGLLANTEYEVRAQLVADLDTVWTIWLSVTTPDIRLSEADLAQPFLDRITDAEAAVDAATAQAQTADAKAQSVRNSHDALVSGFTGNLTDAFAGVQGGITSITADLSSFYDSSGKQIKASALTSYYTKTATDSAIAAKGTTLQANIDALSGQVTDIVGLNISPSSALATSLTQLQASVTTAKATADGKGKVFFQTSAPATDDRLPQNLWIDTTGGANTPKRWNGTAWTAVSDKAATDAKNSVTSLAATVTAQGSAIADLETGASAGYLIKAQAGGAVSLIDLIAADGSGAAPSSIVRIKADDILLDGSVSAQKLTIHDNSAVFSEVFDSAIALDGWEGVNGSSGEVAIVTSANAKQGGKVLRAGNNAGNDQVWYVSKTLIPFDADRTYRMRVGVHQVSGADNKIYAGYVGVAADGVTLVNNSGANSHSQQHYHCINGQILTVGEYLLLEGYTQGHGEVSGTNNAGSLEEPAKVHPNVRYLRPLVIVNYSNKAGVCEIDFVKVDTVSDATLIADGAITTSKIVAGAITGQHVEAGSLDASVIGAGKIDAAFLNVNELLTIDAANAGFSMGKVGATDQSVPGIYLGTTPGAAGNNFGFLAGTSFSGKDQYVQITQETGLRIQNARHYVSAAPPTEDIDVTATPGSRIVLPVGTARLSLKLLGGGGGGGTKENVGGNGGQTLVRLFDGNTYTGVSWSSAGAVGGAKNTATSTNGANSALGTGGGRGYGEQYELHESPMFRIVAPKSATGYGAGGGGSASGTQYAMSYGYGGQAAGIVYVTEYDLLSITNPQLEITIGGKGIGGASAGDKGGDGSPGIVKYAATAFVATLADVVPLSPQAVGTLSNKGPFPDLGSGLWLLTCAGTEQNVALGTMKTDNSGTNHSYTYGSTITFFSEITPVIVTNGNAARTLNYKFYSMGAWG
ncbi:phage tail protein [Phaeovulum sp.]|uniref:phage tail protein n=1 Tax=Phaeovulum sp. TaxID=2934796 RepID=UPI0039E5AC38